MKNKETYADELIDIALSHQQVAVDSRTLKPVACPDIECKDCIAHNGKRSCKFVIQDWANAEYKEPCPFEKDELVEVSQDNKIWQLRYFAGICWDDSRFLCYTDQKKSDENPDILPWNYCQKYGTLGGLESNEKQIPMKPKMIVTDYGVITEFICSACGTIHRASDTKGLSKCKYCDECGQMIDWE